MASSAKPAPTGTVVEIRDLTLAAGGHLLLENAQARFEPGQVTLILGPSGAGKSLLLKLLAGLLDGAEEGVRFSGQVLFSRQDVSHCRQPRPVGVVFQNFALFDELSPRENVKLARAHAARQEESADPADLLRELRVPQDVRTASLSGGQRQRLAIARTLAYHPEVVLYDEPTSGLDPVTARQVAALIQGTHQRHPKTSIVVTHDYAALAGIADRIYMLDPRRRALVEVSSQAAAAGLPAPPARETPPPANRWKQLARDALRGTASFLQGTSRVVEESLLFPLRLLPLWKSPAWGGRFLLHYLRLVAGPSAWLYLALAGAIMGFVSTYFTFQHFPYAQFTAPLLTDEILRSLGFAMYRILVPVLATILIAARCGAAVAADVGGKSYGQQIDALRTFGLRPERYLLTGVCWAFLLGSPLLVAISFFAAKLTSLAVFAASEPAWGPYFWDQHFHRALRQPSALFYQGTLWLLLKVLLCAAGTAQIAYHRAARPKYSTRDVAAGITSTILWSTLYVLVVHFALAFVEFD